MVTSVKKQSKISNNHFFGAIRFQNEKCLYPKDLLRIFLIVLLIVLIVILAGGNTSNQDIQSSIWEFSGNYGIKEGEWLNWLIISFCNRHNISFEWYHLLLYVTGYLLIFYTIHNNIKISLIGLIAYFIFPFTIDFIQTPNFVSMAFVIFSLNFLVKRNKFINRFFFLLFILLGAGMQVVAYFFLPLVLLPSIINEKKMFKIGLVLMVVSLTITIFDKLTNVIGITLGSLSFSNDLRFYKYIDSTTNFGFLVYWIAQLAAFFLMWLVIKNEKSKLDKNNKRFSFFLVVFSIVCYGFVLMPIISRSGTLFRVERNYLVLVVFAWCAYAASIKNSANRLISYLIPTALVVFLFLTMNGSGILSDLSNIFKDNWILN